MSSWTEATNNKQEENDFIEIRALSSEPKLPDQIEVYITRVKPQQCSPLIKALQQQFDTRSQAIVHLKRVKKPCKTESSTEYPPTKKSKTNDGMLEVLLGAVDDDTNKNDWSSLLEKYSCSSVETRWVPGRPAESKEELDKFTKTWPTVYFHKQTQEHKQQELALTKDELKEMREGMTHALEDAREARKLQTDNDTGSSSCIAGAVIMCPKIHTVVATANEERKLQQQDGERIPDAINPLVTSVLLAIQGVSRKERAAAVGHGMDSESFQKGQYLCTGYVLCDSKVAV